MKLTQSTRRQVTIVIGLLLTLLISGCVRSMEVDIDDLLSNPRSHQGREICTEGVYAAGFEINALAASTLEDGDAVYLTEPAIWLEGAEIRARNDCFTSGTTPPVEFCKVTVCGSFEYGGNYGHVGAYEYELRGANY
jgi:hypothetical protein